MQHIVAFFPPWAWKTKGATILPWLNDLGYLSISILISKMVISPSSQGTRKKDLVKDLGEGLSPVPGS